MINVNWTWSTDLPDGSARQYRLAYDGQHLHWWEQPDPDPDNHDPGMTVRQDVPDFRQFGPPEHPTFEQAPREILLAACQTLGVSEPPGWTLPLPATITAWLNAADAGDIASLDRLHAAGVSVNATDHQLRSALTKASFGRNVAATRWLLEHGADVNQASRYGGTVLMTAALLRDKARTRLYLDHGADRLLRNSGGKTACLIAIESRAPLGMIMDLCAPGQMETEAFLHAAAAACHINVLGWMQHVLPDLNQPGPGKHRWPPLLACFHSTRFHPAVPRFLVEHGASLTALDAMDGATMLHRAATANLPWLVPMCLAAGVAVDYRDCRSNTALSQAVTGHEKPRLVRALMQAGADPGLKVSRPPVPGANVVPEFETITTRAFREGHIWSHWLMFGAGTGSAWSGLCCHAHVRGKSGLPDESESDGRTPGEFWLEFPAEWCASPAADLQLRWKHALSRISTLSGRPFDDATVRVDVLPRSASMKQPWEWPGHDLWAIFPDSEVTLVPKLREHRPEGLMADPTTFGPTGPQGTSFKIEWSTENLSGDAEKCIGQWNHGLLTWTVANCETDQTLTEFRLEGPPLGLNLDESIPPQLLDSLCAVVGEMDRHWEAPGVARANRQEAANLRQARLQAQEIAAQQPVPEPPPISNAEVAYARIDVEDRFTTASGSPGGPNAWQCWMEFPATWLGEPPPHLDSWLKSALEQAYRAMNEQSGTDPEGGVLHLLKCKAVALTTKEARLQPWARGNRVLYLLTDLATAPLVAEGKARFRPITSS